MIDRLQALADVGAQTQHERAVTRGEPDHADPYGRCPHPDCKLLQRWMGRTPAADLPDDPLAQRLASYEASLFLLLNVRDWPAAVRQVVTLVTADARK